MTEEMLKDAYRAIEPPRALRGKVLAESAAARRERARRRKRSAALAACLLLVVSLSVYAASPVPQFSSGAQMLTGETTVPGETIVLAESAVRGSAKADTPAMFSLGEDAEDCIALTAERAEEITVSCGTLYRFDTLSGTATELALPYRAAAGEVLYWQVGAPDGTLTARAGLRSRKITAERTGEGWRLCG